MTIAALFLGLFFLSHIHQFHYKNQFGVRGNGSGDASLAVTQMRRNEQYGFIAYAHFHQSFFKTGNHRSIRTVIGGHRLITIGLFSSGIEFSKLLGYFFFVGIKYITSVEIVFVLCSYLFFDMFFYYIFFFVILYFQSIYFYLYF